MDSLLGMFTEDNGNTSSMRIMTAMTMGCTGIDWMHAIFTVGVWSPEVQTIGLVLGVLGGKVAQKKFEA